MKIWFQNRRSKIKKQNKQPDADSSSSSICVVGGSHGNTAARGRTTPPIEDAADRSYRDDDDDTRRMFPPDSSIVYRRRELQSAAAAAYSHQLRVASEPEASNVRLAEPSRKMHLMTTYDVDVQPARRHHDDLLPAQQLVMPSIQLLSGFHPAAAAACSESSSAWPNNIGVSPRVRDAAAGEQVSINYDTDAGDSSPYVPWYSHHLIDSYSPRWTCIDVPLLLYCMHIIHLCGLICR